MGSAQEVRTQHNGCVLVIMLRLQPNSRCRLYIENNNEAHVNRMLSQNHQIHHASY